MKKRKTIRHKLLTAVLVLSAVIGALGYSGFRGAYAYRDLAVTLSERASEFPLTSELTRAVDDLHFRFDRKQSVPIDSGPTNIFADHQRWREHYFFRDQLLVVREILSMYRVRLTNGHQIDALLADRSEELEKVGEIERLLSSISARHNSSDILSLGHDQAELQNQELQRLSDLAHQLPTFLYDRMASFRDEVRSRYRTWIGMAWISTLITFLLLSGLCFYVRQAVIAPFKTLLSGSRIVASGNFSYRIEIDSEDELSELAEVINTGTENFLRIQRDLNDQVRERTREVIRNEQLASVGFLAAGVAHEINNPLASIAWSAEALESRLHNILHPNTSIEEGPQTSGLQDIDTLRSYLRRIQEEAFRCKGITERLLDFSRLGQAQKKQYTDLTDLVADVIEMVQHLGQYRSRKIEFQSRGAMQVWASPQEMKQVILNLLTNALDSLPEDSNLAFVRIDLENHRDFIKLVIEDNGCGMTDEVRQHLFEPFFTRRRDGRGTGLGLPITSRIIADHGGRILPYSAGVGKGSRFEVLLPSRENAETHDSQLQAA